VATAFALLFFARQSFSRLLLFLLNFDRSFQQLYFCGLFLDLRFNIVLRGVTPLRMTGGSGLALQILVVSPQCCHTVSVFGARGGALCYPAVIRCLLLAGDRDHMNRLLCCSATIEVLTSSYPIEMGSEVNGRSDHVSLQEDVAVELHHDLTLVEQSQCAGSDDEGRVVRNGRNHSDRDQIRDDNRQAQDVRAPCPVLMTSKPDWYWF
jgi:hypothetical protein